MNITETDKYEYILTYSFPCSLAGWKVKTKKGYKKIEDITVGEMVLTHNNRYKKVIKTMNRTKDEYYKIKYLGGELKLTKNHPLYVYRDDEFQWVAVKDLKITDKLTFNINQKSKNIDITNEMLWLLGRYVADGWHNKYHYNSVSFAINENKMKEFENNSPKELIQKAKIYHKTCPEYRIADKSLKELCLQFGNGAKNKEIPQWIVDLPKNKLEYFLQGYLSGDGYFREEKNEIMFCTVSENLFYGLQDIMLKLYERTCSMYKRIDNRKDTFNDSYNGQLTLTDDKSRQFVVEDKNCVIIRKIELIEEKVEVYNIAVEDDESYTLNNVIVHNCTDLSLAGKREGMAKGSGTRSGLLWEVERLLEECENKPQVLLMENVVQVHGAGNEKHFANWCSKLQELGYTNYAEDLRADDYILPQIRNRCFMVSILGDYSYNFPQKFKEKYVLEDFLEEKVDKKYYLSEKQLKGMIKTNFESYKLENKIQNPKGNSNTIIAGYDRAPMVIMEQVMTKDTKNYIEWKEKGKLDIDCRVYKPKGKSPTLTTKAGNIKILEATKKGYAEAEHGDGIYINRTSAKRGVVQKQKCQTLKTSQDIGVVLYENNKFVVRKYTPKESLNLMGIKDEDYNKIDASNSRKYFVAGNSICVTVLMGIFGSLLDIDYRTKIEEWTYVQDKNNK